MRMHAQCVDLHSMPKQGDEPAKSLQSPLPCSQTSRCNLPCTFRRCRTTTGSDTTMNAFGPKASLKTPPLSMNLQRTEHAFRPLNRALQADCHSQAGRETRHAGSDRNLAFLEKPEWHTLRE